AIWLCTPEQVRVLDRCEGRGSRYRLARVTTGEVRLDDGVLVDRPLAYVAAAEGHGRTVRYPLLVDGEPVRCARVPQAAAAALVGEPATTDGLALLVVDGAPVPTQTPNRLFVYGTLQPGASHWPMLEPYAAAPPRRASLPGTLYDTGFGYPALRLGTGPGVSGWVVELIAPAALLSIVDEYEGKEYRRVRVALGDELAWTYVWIDPFDGMRALTAPWQTT
ncbi:MAG TPA: gamma-glutamylcyclotransferase family protein, partial [Actinophytocola sp.]|nr:gamma-glutamylcyclotransferase family protein [Actinophytocola sp.]